ncbi:MAG: hypothetical protein ACC707_15060 [Thiohalomonadales bacterium]
MTSLFLLPYRAILTISLAFLITACEIKTENSLPDVPPTGFYAAVGANQHSGQDNVQVAVAIFNDGNPVKLVGGDVVQARTPDDSILLLKPGFYLGSYAASLPNSSNYEQIKFLIVHEPIAAREGRWYPVDLINIDPGPGELVGGSAEITLPPEPTITNKIDVEGKIFNLVTDSVDISWAPLPDADIMKIRAAVTCSNDVKTITYGIEALTVAETDDGFESINLDQFIIDIFQASDEIKLIADEARAMLQELLENDTKFSKFENIFKTLEPMNPIANDCDIELFLFRQRAGNFESPATNGKIFGSRSSEVNIQYRPNITNF